MVTTWEIQTLPANILTKQYQIAKENLRDLFEATAFEVVLLPYVQKPQKGPNGISSRLFRRFGRTYCCA